MTPVVALATEGSTPARCQVVIDRYTRLDTHITDPRSPSTGSDSVSVPPEKQYRLQ